MFHEAKHHTEQRDSAKFRTIIIGNIPIESYILKFVCFRFGFLSSSSCGIGI